MIYELVIEADREMETETDESGDRNTSAFDADKECSRVRKWKRIQTKDQETSPAIRCRASKWHI